MDKKKRATTPEKRQQKQNIFETHVHRALAWPFGLLAIYSEFLAVNFVVGFVEKNLLLFNKFWVVPKMPM